MTSNCGGMSTTVLMSQVSGLKSQVSGLIRNLRLETCNLRLFQAVRLVTSQRKVFSQCVPLPGIGQQYAAQVRMIVKDDSKQIVGFAFVPIRRPPDTGDAGDVSVMFVEQHLQTHPAMLRRRKEMIVDFEARLFFRPAIKAAEVCEKVEFKIRRRLKKRANRHNVFAR